MARGVDRQRQPNRHTGRQTEREREREREIERESWALAGPGATTALGFGRLPLPLGWAIFGPMAMHRTAEARPRRPRLRHQARGEFIIPHPSVGQSAYQTLSPRSLGALARANTYLEASACKKMTRAPTSCFRHAYGGGLLATFCSSPMAMALYGTHAQWRLDVAASEWKRHAQAPNVGATSWANPTNERGEYLRRMRAAHYFSNVFTRKGLALTPLPKCPLRRDSPWVPHARAELRGQNLQGATNDICIAPHLARFGAQSMDGLMEQTSVAVQLKSITEWAQNP